jgi:hypothetical protein
VDDFERWRQELIDTGRIVQDDDPPELLDKGEEWCRRYVELVDQAQGIYEQNVFQALIDSMQVEEDYEVYESTKGALWSFPASEFGRWFAQSLPDLIARQPEWAGDFLSAMINGARAGDPRLEEFKTALRKMSGPDKRAIRTFVRAQEEHGWLDTKPGWYDDAFDD